MSFKWQRYLDQEYMVTTIQSTRIDSNRIEDHIENFKVSRGFVWELINIYATPYPNAETVFVWKKVGDDG